MEGIRFCEVVKLLFSLLGALHFLPPLLCSSFLLWKNERTPTPNEAKRLDSWALGARWRDLSMNPSLRGAPGEACLLRAG